MILKKDSFIDSFWFVALSVFLMSASQCSNVLIQKWACFNFYPIWTFHFKFHVMQLCICLKSERNLFPGMLKERNGYGFDVKHCCIEVLRCWASHFIMTCDPLYVTWAESRLLHIVVFLYYISEWACEFRKQWWSWTLAVSFCSCYWEGVEVIWISTLESWSLGCPCWHMSPPVHKVRVP